MEAGVDWLNPIVIELLFSPWYVPRKLLFASAVACSSNAGTTIAPWNPRSHSRNRRSHSRNRRSHPGCALVHTKVSQSSSELPCTFTPRLTKPGSRPVADGTVRDVEGRSSEFVLAETGGASVELLRAKLATSFSVSGSGRSRPVRTRRTWLDTFDWRLYKAGLTLHQVTAGRSSQLILTGLDGEQVTAPVDRPATLRWPALVTRLPAGALRDSLISVTGNRALLPVVTAASQASDLRLLNGDEKTVARLSIDALTVSHPAASTHRAPGTAPSKPGARSKPGAQSAQPARSGAHGVLPARLTVHEVRGYPSAARRAGGCWPERTGSRSPARSRSTPPWRPTAVMPWTTPARSTSNCAPACPAGRRFS